MSTQQIVRDGWTLEELKRVEVDLATQFPLTTTVESANRWGGTEQEYDRLVDAVQANAECASCEDDMSQVVCSGHSLLDSQTTLDHMLAVYRNRSWYREGEWVVTVMLSVMSVWCVCVAIMAI